MLTDCLKKEGINIPYLINPKFHFTLNQYNFINKIGKGACRIHCGGFEGTIQFFLNDDFVKYISGISEKL